MTETKQDKPKILMVDDKPENLIVLEKLLAPLNCDLYKATSGNEALSLTLENDFVLALLDVQMPGMDGYEVLEMMSWEERTRHIPVIFITANYADEQHKLKGYEYGAVDYLYKPINETILLGKIKVFLELHEKQMQYKQLQQRYQLILDAAGEGVFGTDTRGVINFINPAGAKMLGYPAEALIGQPFATMLHLNDEQNFSWDNSDFQKTCASGHTYHKGDDNFRRKDSTPLPVEYTASPLHDIHDDYIGTVVVFTDITLRKTVEEQLTHLALYDHLTKLPNRLLFEKTITQTIARARRHNRLMALMFLDLDHFKTINDTLGHDVGDLLLQGVAERLKECVRESDTVARLGGDEFAIILDEVDKIEDAAIIAEKILESLTPPFNLDGHEVFASTSIGIAVYPMSGDTSIALTKNADISMYRAKQQGRNNYRFFTSDMNEQSMQRLNLAHSLRRAVEQDQLYLCYQPKLNLKTGEVTGVEALLRWKHPHLGDIAPAEFIPIAEETGLILTIGEWCLQQVCQQIKTWQTDNIAINRVAVNLSSCQLVQGDLVNLVKTALSDSNLDSSCLELELTETSIMTNPTTSATILQDLHDLGVHISIDDFGTGYSSLGYLKSLPVDSLKIDQSFVHDIAEDPNDAAIVKAIIALAHSMDLTVIAEGVETEAQLQFLDDNHCDQIQGYYFSKPKAAADITDFLVNSAQQDPS
ncbi:MAG: diguanylate cyclase [Legionellales bacterium]|nr:diguanylate cyclase [Legionellales bacterium]|tara:strand:+ start:46041 stop:48146 length:2106 start_codon:yes stop_codon:yes gene_type:complete